MQIDSERIRLEIDETESLIAKEKANYRGIDWRLAKNPGSSMRAHRHRLKPAATVLYAIIAHSRGRVHRHDHDLEKQEEWLKHVIKDYVLKAA